MSTPRLRALPPEEEVQQLRARIAELEVEVGHLRGSAERQERKNADALAREIEVQYKEVFETVSVCMFLVDVISDGRFKYAGFNPAEEKAVGLTSAEVSGRFVEDLFPEDLAKKVTANYRRCVEAGTTIHYDDELNLPSGRRYFHSNLIPVRDNAGRVQRIVGACIDTTEFKRTQEEALARQKLESLGVLAAGIAHDFNNLLGSILAETELAETELAVGSPPVQELQTIKNVAIRAGEMVRELMIYSGQEDAILDSVDLSQLVAEMLELLQISISKRAKLIIDLPKSLPAVRANAAQIRQVVMNLITNASEALGDQEGLISVTIAVAGPGRDSFSQSQGGPCQGKYLRLEVRDTGCGMTEELQSSIFDPFFTTKIAGRGLGLAAVQGIIRSHGGTIDVVSAPGEGSHFQVLLPCTSQRAEDTVPMSTPAFGAVAGAVLVVEDEDILRRAVSKMLRQEGYSVIEADDGKTGANLFRANERDIDVILLDVTLPGMSGKEVLEELRRIRPDVKVIVTTAYGRDKAFSSIGGQYPWGYVRKPYQLSELTTLLRKACMDKP